jgi:transposase
LFHIDDTFLRLLNPDGSKAIRRETKHIDPNRTGQNTTGILTVNPNERRVALFFTGQRHAGENLLDLLEQRPSGLHPPILMSDALSRNTSGIIGAMMIYCAYCLAHAR